MSRTNTLPFKIPTQRAASGSLFPIDPKRSAEWLAELPLANVGETARLVYKALTELNRLAMPGLTRVRIAEQFRESVRFLEHSLLTRYSEAAFPIPTKTRKIALLNRELHQQLATAFKIVLVQQAADSDESVDRKLLAVAGARALYYSTSVLLHSALIYESPPPGTWHEMYEIFVLMQEHGQENTPVQNRSPTQSALARITPEGLYGRAMLFALVSPFRMRQRDMLSLIDALPNWESQAPISPLGRAHPGETLCVMDTSGDSPPSLRTITMDDRGRQGLVMSTAPAVQALRGLIEDAAGGEERRPGRALPKPVLRQIAVAWSETPERRFVRTRLNFDLELAIGLEDIYALLISFSCAPAEHESGSAQKTTGEGGGWLDGVEELSGQVWAEPEPPFQGPIDDDDSVFVRTGIGLSPTDRLSGWGAKEVEAPVQDVALEPPRTFRFRTLNESAGGYCVSWEGSAVPQVKVGELVGVQSTKSPEQFGVGVIRWMKHELNTGHQLGIQMLAAMSLAVEVRATRKGRSQMHKGLLLPKPKHLAENPCLLTAPLVLRTGDEVCLAGNGPLKQVALNRVVESTGAFSRFQFEERKAGDHAGGKSGRDDASGEFESLWESL